MKLIFVLFGFIATIGLAEIPPIYRVAPHDLKSGEKINFISLSEMLAISDHPDSLTIPSEFWGEVYRRDVDLVLLEGVYRKRFLKGTGLTESDSLFIYDFQIDSIVSFSIKSLTVCAIPNVYLGDNEFIYDQYQYHVGFRINDNLDGFSFYFENAFAAFGRKSPFEKGKMQPLEWMTVEASQLPKVEQLDRNGAVTANLRITGSYLSKQGHFGYYLQDLYENERYFGRHLIVMDMLTDKIVLNQQFYESEGASGAPLNSAEGGVGIYQWTGVLFKNYPPVVLGFEFFSFSCESICFFGEKKPAITIKCDNRH